MNSITIQKNKTQTSDLSGWVKNIFSLIQGWYRKSGSRRQLHDLPSHLLDDIGISQEQARQESAKSFWQ